MNLMRVSANEFINTDSIEYIRITTFGDRNNSYVFNIDLKSGKTLTNVTCQTAVFEEFLKNHKSDLEFKP